MSNDEGRLAWLHWPTVAKGFVAGIGSGLILALAFGDFKFGMALGIVNGIAFGVGWSHSQRAR